MRRGVDSTVRAKIKDGFDLSLIERGEVLLEQGDVKLYKPLTIDRTTRYVTTDISAEESLMFEVGSYKIKFRYLMIDGKTASMRPVVQSVGEGFDNVMEVTNGGGNN